MSTLHFKARHYWPPINADERRFGEFLFYRAFIGGQYLFSLCRPHPILAGSRRKKVDTWLTLISAEQCYRQTSQASALLPSEPLQ
jgi:hypothetical protein